jgi:hypothetical protein
VTKMIGSPGRCCRAIRATVRGGDEKRAGASVDFFGRLEVVRVALCSITGPRESAFVSIPRGVVVFDDENAFGHRATSGAPAR